LTKIDSCVFGKCSSLQSIYIPESVREIAESAFEDCTSLQKIEVADDNPVYDSRQGCNAIIETLTDKLIMGCQSTVIPDTVKIIGEEAFRNSLISNIAIPASVTDINDDAFQRNMQKVRNLYNEFLSIDVTEEDFDLEVIEEKLKSLIGKKAFVTVKSNEGMKSYVYKSN
jgi:hypothetical protein